MKTDERKENETNSLRHWVNGVVEKFQGRAVYPIVGAIVLALALFFIVRYYILSREAAASNRWMEFNSADSLKKLTELIGSKDHQDRGTSVASKVELARIALYAEGINKLGSLKSKDRDAAAAKVEEGRELYLKLANDLKEQPALLQEAYLSCARAEEVLLGTPKTNNSAEERGSFDKMIEYYRKAAAVNPESDAGKSYTAKANELQGKREEMVSWYRELYRLGITPDFSTKKGNPFGP